MFYQKIVKRFFDINVSILIFIVLLPLLLIVSFLILTFDGRPILFKQDRPGHRGKIFKLLKFRTMHMKMNKSQKDNERISKLGNFLRKNSLEE